jgi:hypothetical protein
MDYICKKNATNCKKLDSFSLSLSFIVVTIICSADENVVLVQSYRIHDIILSFNVSQELTFWTFPDFYVIGGCRSEGILLVMEEQRFNGFLVVGKGLNRFACSDVP